MCVVGGLGSAGDGVGGVTVLGGVMVQGCVLWDLPEKSMEK